MLTKRKQLGHSASTAAASTARPGSGHMRYDILSDEKRVI